MWIVSRHCDWSHEFFALWLGETMTCSLGLFPGEQDNLYRAQLNKCKAVSARLRLAEPDLDRPLYLPWRSASVDRPGCSEFAPSHHPRPLYGFAAYGTVCGEDWLKSVILYRDSSTSGV